MIALLQDPLKHKAAALQFGFRQDIEYLDNAAVDHLQWLQEKTVFPRFYWQSRDGQLEIAAAGAARVFSSLELAQQFIQFCAPTDFQPLLVGGMPFPRSGVPDSDTVTKPGCHAHSASSDIFFLPEQALIRRGRHTFLVRFVSLRQAPSAGGRNGKGIQANQAGTGTYKLPVLETRTDRPDRNQWCELVNKVIQPDALALTPKVVLARRSRFTVRGKLNQYTMLRRWQQIEPHTMPYLLQLSEDNCFLGCSPERLYRRRGRDLITEALAGTVEKMFTEPSGEVSANTLRSDVKIRRENYLVQDYIKRQLVPFCETVRVSPTADVVELKYVQHLRKLITGLLKAGVADETIIRALHPTPAVGGSPRGESLRFITTHEQFRRGWYAGAIGYLSADEAEFSVAIRSAEIRPQQIDFYAGAGIVAGSEAAAEWQELDNKIESVLNLFEYADQQKAQ